MEKKRETTESQISPDKQYGRERFEGTVIWFNGQKGFGFIKPTKKEVNDGKDIFVHFQYIIQKGFKTLRQGDLVEFSIGRNSKGIAAYEILIKKAVDDAIG